MDRYSNLDLDLECDGGGGGGEGGGRGVSQKAALFGGMFKKPSKPADPPAKAQDSSSVNGDVSQSGDGPSDSGIKDKRGMFKGVFKKTNKSTKEEEAQITISSQNPELSVSSDSLSDSKPSKEKSGMLGGILKRSPRPGHARRPSQDLLDISDSNENVSDSINTKESGGMFSGMFKKSPKANGLRAASQDDLSAHGELSKSNDSLSNTKESGGVFNAMFRKPFGARAQSQEDLTADKEQTGSSENLSENQTKEKGGLLSGMFRKKGAKTQSQDDLSVDEEPSASSDNPTEKSSKGGAAAKILRNPFSSSAQEKERSENSGDSNEISSSAQKPKAKQNGFSALMKSTFHSDKQEKSSSTDEDEALEEDEDKQHAHKQSKLAGAMTKLNPFRSANKSEKQTGSDDEDQTESSKQKDPEDTETPEDNRKRPETKPKPDKGNVIQPERRKRSEALLVPPRSSEEETEASPRHKVQHRRPEETSERSAREIKEKRSGPPALPAKPSKEELNRIVKHQQNNHQENPSGDEGDESTTTKDGGEKRPENKPTKVKKLKHPNPFMPQVALKAASDDEGLKDDEDSSSREKKEDEEGKEKPGETKVKKPKRHNPFMPQVKAKVIQKKVQDGAAGSAENDGPSRTLFDQLEDFRIDPSQPENNQDVEDLMEWWNTVESWEDTPQAEDMTEKEEAKAFAVTADKVQKGIRVFNKLFSERAESLWQHVIDLNAIADGLDKFNKNTKIAQITGGSTSAIGGVATIAGLALAPVTMGTSLIVTAVGLGVAAAGGLTSAGAGISNQVNNSMDRKKVERIVEDYQEKIADLNKCLKFIKQGIENLRRFDLIKMKKHAYNQDFPALTSQFYEDGAMAGKAILINANEIMRVVQIANVAGSTAARAVQIASMATGVLTGLFVGMDIYFVAKDSKELKKGAKSEFAAKIREVATQLHEGLVELNTIREELQSTTPEHDQNEEPKDPDGGKKDTSDKYDSSSEDEIDRIKKAIKKDLENREYV
ncbi:apolipoprotein L1 isoform X2 [Kryptolebias marmoratus]|uniref:Apolipoprotein L, 1 n=1 Tax=Kryptolebias marmoratus TaxID=37003 RepID=A0A3Q3GLQ5_KRYMA|nr:apolipoprotein L1 isoform X2 [Kryptolebias marmoratus]